MSLYKVWATGKRHPAWPDFPAFRDWTLREGWLEEYGFEGEFTPENLKLAIQKKEPGIDPKKDCPVLKPTKSLDQAQKLIEQPQRGKKAKKEADDGQS